MGNCLHTDQVQYFGSSHCLTQRCRSGTACAVPGGRSSRQDSTGSRGVPAPWLCAHWTGHRTKGFRLSSSPHSDIHWAFWSAPYCQPGQAVWRNLSCPCIIELIHAAERDKAPEASIPKSQAHRFLGRPYRGSWVEKQYQKTSFRKVCAATQIFIILWARKWASAPDV